MADKKAQEEYLRRNLIHCKAAGVQAGIKEAIDRLESHSKAPRWLLDILYREYDKTPDIRTALAEYRDEIHDRAWKDTF